MLQPHHRTLAQIRLLTSLKLTRRRKRQKRLTPQQQPDAIRLEYFKAIRPVCVRAKQLFDGVRQDILQLLIELRARQEKTDARGVARMDVKQTATRKALALVDEAADRMHEAFRPRELYAAAEKFGQRTSKHQKEQLSRQVEEALGIPLAAIEKPITEKLEGFAALNVDLIKTVPERYFDRLRADTLEAFEGGMHPETLAEHFTQAYGIQENDAMRIARDQIGKLNGQLNQERQEAMGVTSYIWRTLNDGRVREEHEEREGESYAWDNPPEDGHPGEPIQCRCYSEPDFDALLEDLDSLE